MEHPASISLTAVAEELGVHYMTAYRYVRTGRLPATRDGAQWRVDRADLDRFRLAPSEPAARGTRAEARARLERRLIAGDVVGSWSIVERTLAAGATPTEIHLELIAPSLRSIGERWAAGEITVADEHRATVVAQRVIGRLGPQFSHRGRTRGTVVVGAPAGEAHALPSAILSDVLRDARFGVVDLGADTPPQSFAGAARDADRLVAVCIGASSSGHDRALRAAIEAVKGAAAPAPVLVGGGAVADAARARRLGADGWTGADARAALAAIEGIAPPVRPPRKR